MIFQTDVYLRVLLEESIQDIKENPWLLQHILWDFTHNPFLKTRYGEKQVRAAIEWFETNNINVFHQFIKDKLKFPAIAITLGSSTEAQELRTLGDIDTETIGLAPTEVKKIIPYVVPPFIPVGFEPSTGTVEVPEGIDIVPVSAGMVLLNPLTGVGTPVLSIDGQNIIVQPNLELDASELAVVPQYRYFQTRLGRSFFQETWNLTCATNDVQTLLWLHSIVIFGLLRYREFMEHNGILEITNLSSTDIFNADFSNPGGEEIYCRQVTVTSKVQQSWPRDLHRKIESTLIRSKNSAAETVSNPKGFVGGIRIVSNLETPLAHQNDTTWYTISEQEAEADTEEDME
jgi:hypothetical protein